MIDQAARFAGDIPANYDSGLGPHLFVDYAADLARRATAAKPGRVLELAAGTGIVTRMLRDALPDSTHLVASDLNPPMLEMARQKFSADEKVEFQPADATALPFADGAFDTLVCQFGVMFFPDKDKSYREAYRVLASGGRYHFNVWDSFEFNPFARIAHDHRPLLRAWRADLLHGSLWLPPDRCDQGVSGRSRVRRHLGPRAQDQQRNPKGTTVSRRVGAGQSSHRGDSHEGAFDPGFGCRRHDRSIAQRLRPRSRMYVVAGDRVRRTQALKPERALSATGLEGEATKLPPFDP